MNFFFGGFHRLATLCVILLTSALMSSPLWAQNCAPNDFTLNTQAEVDAFPAGCDTVVGDLSIEGADITDLTPLAALTSVGGYLWIVDNSALTNLDGLAALTSVSSYLVIGINHALTNLDSLSGLTSVGGDLQIEINGALTDIDGLSALTNVGGNLHITRNTTLANLNGLSALTSMGGLFINQNPELTHLDGLSAVTSVNSFLWIHNNAALANVNGLSALASVGGYLQISDNPTLTQIDGLSALTSVGDFLYIYDNDALTNLDGLSALASVDGILRIEGNTVLTNLDGLSALTSVGGYLWIIDNSALTGLDGLLALTSVGGFLHINFNAALASVGGLTALTSVGDDLLIDNNPVLTNLDGLAALISVGTNVILEDNPQLADCYALEPLLNDVDNPPPGPGVPPIPDVGGAVFISNNLPGCNTVDQILAIQPAEGTAVLAIDKVFIDGNDETPVTLRLQCDGGSYTPHEVVVTADDPGGDYEQAFVVFNIPPGGVENCTVTEDPVPGYHSISVCAPDSMSTLGELCLVPDDILANVYDLDGSACQWTDIQAGDSNRCDFVNFPETVEVEITKVWDVVNTGGKNFSMGVDIDFDCSNEAVILGPDYWSLGNNDFEYLDDHTAIATVTTQVIPRWFPAASNTVTECWAEEYNLASGVETESDCGSSQDPGMELTVGGDDTGCTITNTMFFEGIPTLSQYGMAILALLMLSLGLVGFRRYA